MSRQQTVNDYSKTGGITVKRHTVALLTLGLAVLAIVPPAMAHHSFSAEFDSKQQVELQGFVTKVEWTNPHVWFYINVTDPATGRMTNWGFEMGPPHGLQAGGWTRETMKLGDEVRVNGSRAKNGSNKVNARNVILVKTGKKMGAASSEGDAATQ
jgi:hypothetical protein